jgi:Tol biopolymer transport system component/predicted Ser/Thr protein kinase
MGEVFKGRDTRLNRGVAIKVLPADFAQDAQLRLRFEREARTISQLNHPNICTVYDVGENYLVMELLEGETLADRLTRGPLPLEQVIKVGTQIADALDRAHKAGIVHRDLKPSNVMLTKGGAKLLDFGLAKNRSSVLGPRSAVDVTMQKPLTQEGTVVGTYQYMAPEQLAGEEADARTDIFALGAVLYEMATGHRAFEGKTKTSIVTAIVSRDPAPMSQIEPMTPPVLEHIVRKCLTKDPEDRWQSAHDIASELRWIGDSGSSAVLAPQLIRSRRSRERLLWIVGLLVAAAATFGIARRWHVGETRPVYRFTIPMTDRGYRAGNLLAISSDGKTVYFVVINASGRNQIFRRRLDEATATPVEGTDGATGAVPTPDGRSLMIFSGGEVRRVNAEGGAAEKISISANTALAVNSDGVVLIGAVEGPIARVSPTGGPPMAVTKLEGGETGHDRPAFLPDGKHFFFITHVPEPKTGAMNHVLCVGSLDSSETKRLGPFPSRVEYAAGHLYFVRDGVLMCVPFDLRTLTITGEPVVIADGVAYSSRNGNASFSVAADGTLVYQPLTLSAQLTWIDRTGRMLGTVGPKVSPGGAFLGSTSPSLPTNSYFTVTSDGKRLVQSTPQARTGVFQLWVSDLQRPVTAARLTFTSANEYVPVVSHDGHTVYYGSDINGNVDIYSTSIDGGEEASLVVSGPNSQTPRDVSADGKYLLYGTNQDYLVTKSDLWIAPLFGDRKPFPYVRTPGNEVLASISPDGKWAAYISDVSGQRQIYIKAFPGPGPARQIPASNSRTPRWSADGKHLYFTYEKKFFMCDIRDGVPSEPRLLFEEPNFFVGLFWPSPDEQRFLMMLTPEDETSEPLHVITGWTPPKS